MSLIKSKRAQGDFRLAFCSSKSLICQNLSQGSHDQATLFYFGWRQTKKKNRRGSNGPFLFIKPFHLRKHGPGKRAKTRFCQIMECDANLTGQWNSAKLINAAWLRPNNVASHSRSCIAIKLSLIWANRSSSKRWLVNFHSLKHGQVQLSNSQKWDLSLSAIRYFIKSFPKITGLY